MKVFADRRADERIDIRGAAQPPVLRDHRGRYCAERGAQRQ